MCTKRETLYPINLFDAAHVENAENLLQKNLLQIAKNEPNYTTIYENGYVILDFGKELVGSVRILTYEAKDRSVRIRTGESIGEVSSELGGMQNATNSHALRDFNSTLMGLSDMTFNESGFRYVRIDMISPGEIKIKNIVVESKLLDLPLVYSYDGDNETLKHIYSIAKHTIDLCSANELVWDGIKRDRLVWIGDMHPEMLALEALYGPVKRLEKSLLFVEKTTPLDQWMNGIVTYSMWWVIILGDYFKRAKCTEFIEPLLSRVKAIGSQLLPLVFEDGSLHYKDRILVDWPTSGKIDELSGVRAINIIACNYAIELLEYFNQSSDMWRILLSKLRAQPILPAVNKSVLSLKYWADGSLSSEEAERLADGGAKGLSTFFSYYMLKAIAETKGTEIATSICMEYYGGMIEKGATSFWEDFNVEWIENSGRIDQVTPVGMKDIHGDFGDHCYVGFRHSLCHGWSAGVLAFIKEYC